MQPPRNGELYMGLFKFQLHELAAVRANDTCHDLSAADIDTLFASPGKALFDAALYDVACWLGGFPACVAESLAALEEDFSG